MRLRSWRIWLVLISVPALPLLWSGGGPALAGETEPNPFGVGVYLHRVMDDPVLMGRVADLAAGIGTGWTREEFNWSFVQPARGGYDQARLARLDSMVDLAGAKGLKVLGLITGPSAWSGGLAPASENEYKEFAAFAAFLAGRYRGRITYWEIWNEPNTARFWAPAPDPAAYAGLLKEVCPAVRKADPKARIVAGALSDPQDLVYLFTLFAHGVSPYMDIFSVHPYTSPGPLENTGEEVNLRLMGQLTAQFGPEKPIWITEMGFSTCDPPGGVSQDRQAALLVRAYLTALAAGVRVIQWYDFKDDGTDNQDCEQMFGLITHQSASPPLAPKPAYRAFATMTALLGRSLFKKTLELGYERRGEVFEDRTSAQKTLALWLVDQTGEEREELFGLGLSGSVDSVRDIFGREVTFAHDGTTLSLTLSGSPLYVQGDFEVE